MEWDTVLGLEVHAQLQTQSKLFSGAAIAFGASPNAQTCFIDAALPGVLPVLNQEAVHMAIQFALAVSAEINQASVFERKNYFYPDLPKGYQISQFQKPIVANGHLNITLADGSQKSVEIVRAHLEEDAGKSVHDLPNQYTGIDLNRAGTPLLEIVTAPCLYSAEEALVYLRTLHQLVRFLGICDGSMQEGSFRCDVNLSLKPKGSATLGTRVELKNLNSFRFIEKAILHEQERQQDLLESGNKVVQETRLYNADTNTTWAMRSKENENDYRYFPDPDLLPVIIDDETIASIKDKLPLLPEAIHKALKQVPDLNQEDIDFILSSPAAYRYYQTVKSQSDASDKAIINWMKGNYAALLNEQNLDFAAAPVAADILADLLNRIHTKKLSMHQAKQVFGFLWAGEQNLDAIIEREGLQTVDDDAALVAVIQSIIQQYPEQTAEFKAGKEKLMGFFVGQVMKATKGKMSPERVNELLREHLGQ